MGFPAYSPGLARMPGPIWSGSGQKCARGCLSCGFGDPRACACMHRLQSHGSYVRFDIALLAYAERANKREVRGPRTTCESSGRRRMLQCTSALHSRAPVRLDEYDNGTIQSYMTGATARELPGAAPRTHDITHMYLRVAVVRSAHCGVPGVPVPGVPVSAIYLVEALPWRRSLSRLLFFVFTFTYVRTSPLYTGTRTNTHRPPIQQ